MKHFGNIPQQEGSLIYSVDDSKTRAYKEHTCNPVRPNLLLS